MIFHLKPILIVLFVAIGYEAAIYRIDLAYWVFGVMLFVVIFGTVNFLRRWKTTILPGLYFIGASLLLLFVNRGPFLHFYIGGISLMLYFLLLGLYRINRYKKDETAQKLIFSSALAIVFIWSAAVFGIYLNWHIRSWVLSFLMFIIVFLVSYRLFKVASFKKNIDCFLTSFILGYSMLILSFGVTMLPFSYLTLGTVSAAFYFIFCSYLIQNFQTKINKFSFILDLITFIIIIISVLFTARWGMILN
jgi:hypothetical protein